MIVLQILFGLILVVQLVLVFYFGKKRGRKSTGRKAHDDYAKYQKGELQLDNDCNGIWYETSEEQYEKYVSKHSINQSLMFLNVLINLALNFADFS